MMFISINAHPSAYNDAKRHYTSLLSTACSLALARANAHSSAYNVTKSQCRYASENIVPVASCVCFPYAL